MKAGGTKIRFLGGRSLGSLPFLISAEPWHRPAKTGPIET